MLACLYTSFIKDDRSRRRHLTDKLDDWVGHLNTILARRGGNLNDPIFKSLNARAGGGGGERESFELIGALRAREQVQGCTSLEKYIFWG